MMAVRNVVILGSTGSIGVNTLDVIARHPARFKVLALTAHRQIDRLYAQILEFKPRFAVVGAQVAKADIVGSGHVRCFLTGRSGEFFRKLRHTDGASGFLTRQESEHDAFGAGHAGTALSAAQTTGSPCCS